MTDGRKSPNTDGVSDIGITERESIDLAMLARQTDTLDGWLKEELHKPIRTDGNGVFLRSALDEVEARLRARGLTRFRVVQGGGNSIRVLPEEEE